MLSRTREPAPVSLGAAALSAAALLACLALTPTARGESFVFRDQAKGRLDGKVLAEFDDVLLVALDDGTTRFISRAELAQVVGADGQAHDDPPPGTFARLESPTPLGAVTHFVGEAWIVPAGGEPQPLDVGPGWARAGALVRTGEAGLLRLVLLGDAVLKLGAQSEVGLNGAERVVARQGEVLVETRIRPLELSFLGLTTRLAPGARLGLRTDQAQATTHLLVDRGELELVGADLRLHLSAGQGLALVRTGSDGWRITADTVNTSQLDLHLAGGVEPLRPGETRSFGARPSPEGEVWRVLRSSGELLLSRGQGPATPLAQADLERLALGPGDALETAPTGAQATLVRVDGATASLHEATRLEVGPGLRLARGRLTLETSSAAVSLETPCGVSRLAMSLVIVTRTGADEVHVLASGGEPQLALGPDAQVSLQPGSSARARRLPEGRVGFELELGQARVTSRQGPAGFDPHFSLQLQPGQATQLESTPQGPVLHLPGERALRFETAGVEAEVHLVEPLPEVAFHTGARARLREGLFLGLGRAQELPQLRFKAGPRLILAVPLTLDVHNPTVVFGEPPTTLELTGDISARLQEGGSFAAASVTVRERDRLELPRGAAAVLARYPDTIRLALQDRRRLWIEDAAPPVQARFGDAEGTLFLTMPGAPAMGLPPARPLTVLATEEGEFVVLHGETDDADLEGLEPLVGELRPDVPEAISRDRMRDLLDVPPFDSPSGP